MKKYILLLLIPLFVIVCGFAFYFYSQWQKAVQVIGVSSADEIRGITDIISQVMDLPEGETPTLATVSDKDKLKDQPFFAKAENGDKVLVYDKSSKAILYRPSTKRVVEVAPIYFDDKLNQTTQSTSTPQVSSVVEQLEKNTSTLKLAFFNGSGVSEKHISLADRIKGEFVNAETVVVSNTTGVYSGILVTDLKGNLSTEISAIAQLLGGKTSTLPLGEIKPDADILIIIGK